MPIKFLQAKAKYAGEAANSGKSGSDEGHTNKSNGNDGDDGNRTRAKEGEFLSL
jgi:hypothetical protein